MSRSQKILSFLDKRTTAFGAQYKAFGFFVITCYPLSYVILYYFGDQVNESTTVRFLAFLLCFPLIFLEKWPKIFRKYLNLYWYLTILYSLPFMGTYLLLKNNMSIEWLMNGVLGIFLLVLLVDWLMFIILLSIGICFGYLCFLVMGNQTFMIQDLHSVSLSWYVYIHAIIIGCIFARNKERLEYERIQTLKTLAGAIAHEMRTPLCGIAATAFGLRNFLPSLISSYEKTEDVNLPESPAISKADLEALKEVPNILEKTTGNLFTTVDILLMNLKENPLDTNFELCSIKTCIQDAINESHLDSRDLQLISWKEEEDFEFYGNHLLIKHVLFNLLKNALYYVKAANKGGIFISLESGEENNKLYFKDTGLGIPAANLPHIFDRFYTNSRHGTGIGLAFCKMVMEGLEGSINVSSIQGEFTEFVLVFPRVKSHP